MTHFFVLLALLCSLPSSIKYAHVFGLSTTTSTIVFPPNSSLKAPGTFLFLAIGRDLLSFSS